MSVFIPATLGSVYEGVPCFWLGPTGRRGIRLRRFVFSTAGRPCPLKWGYHDASSEVVAYEPVRYDVDGDRDSPDDRPRDDPAWPTACACGYVFEEGDQWQTNGDLEWRADTGDLFVAEAHHLPPGALVTLDWHPFYPWTNRYGDGINLYAVCPNGVLWHVDGPAINDGQVTTRDAWTRTGNPREPETLTVAPSIVAGDYHGFLQAGRFTDG